MGAAALLAGLLAFAAEDASPDETRAFSGANVDHARPAPPLVHLRLVSPQGRLTFHRMTGMSPAFGPVGSSSGKPFGGPAAAIPRAEYARLCTAPCSVAIPEGTYRLGLSLDGKTVAPGPAIDLRGAAELEGVIVSRTSLRVAGTLLVLASAVGTLLFLVANSGPNDRGSNRALLWGGLAVILIGTPVGIGMVGTPDRADIRVK